MENNSLHLLKNNLVNQNKNHKSFNLQHKINLKDYEVKAKSFFGNKTFCKLEIDLCQDFYCLENESFVLTKKFLIED